MPPPSLSLASSETWTAAETLAGARVSCPVLSTGQQHRPLLSTGQQHRPPPDRSRGCRPGPSPPWTTRLAGRLLVRPPRCRCAPGRGDTAPWPRPLSPPRSGLRLRRCPAAPPSGPADGWARRPLAEGSPRGPGNPAFRTVLPERPPRASPGPAWAARRKRRESSSAAPPQAGPAPPTRPGQQAHSPGVDEPPGASGAALSTDAASNAPPALGPHSPRQLYCPPRPRRRRRHRAPAAAALGAPGRSTARGRAFVLAQLRTSRRASHRGGRARATSAEERWGGCGKWAGRGRTDLRGCGPCEPRALQQCRGFCPGQAERRVRKRGALQAPSRCSRGPSPPGIHSEFFVHCSESQPVCLQNPRLEAFALKAELRPKCHRVLPPLAKAGSSTSCGAGMMTRGYTQLCAGRNYHNCRM